MQQQQEAELLKAFRLNPADSRAMIVRMAQASAERFQAEMNEALASIEATSK